MRVARVLLVDDEEAFVHNMARLLTTRGYRVGTAATGEAALDLLSEQVFDVVVLDLRMPGQGGLATLKTIKHAYPTVQVLILTGHGALDTAFEAMRGGAYDYLAKPCEIDELTAKIEGAWQQKVEREPHIQE